MTADPAFQELWERIRKRTRFEVDVDSEKLVEDACEEIAKMPKVKAPEILSTHADLTVDTAGVNAEARPTALVRTAGRAVYDLPDPIAELQDAVGLPPLPSSAFWKAVVAMTSLLSIPRCF